MGLYFEIEEVYNDSDFSIQGWFKIKPNEKEAYVSNGYTITNENVENMLSFKIINSYFFVNAFDINDNNH